MGSRYFGKLGLRRERGGLGFRGVRILGSVGLRFGMWLKALGLQFLP